MERYGSSGSSGGDSALPLYKASGPRPAAKFTGLGLRDQFQISGYMMLASLVFWIFLCIIGYSVVGYTYMYMSFDDDHLTAADCCTNTGGTTEDNAIFVDKYNKGDAGPYLMRLGPETFQDNFKGTPAPKELEALPPIVTAVTTADFFTVQTLIKQIHLEIQPAHPGIKFIIYDVGLYARELEIIKTHCQCDVRTFRTSSYPDHVADVTTLAYRPIIIQTIIEEYGSVMWIDPASQLTRAADLNQLKYRGERNFFLWQPREYIGTVAYTNPKTFEYLKELPCCYSESGLVDMSALVFYRTNSTWSYIMKPWLKCALNKDCIAPAQSRYSGCFHMRKPKTTGCHRYDQSALSIIMDRMFSFTIKSEKYVIPRISRDIEEHVEYFPEQPWTFTEMFFVFLLPVTCAVGIYFLYKRKSGSRKAAAVHRRR